MDSAKDLHDIAADKIPWEEVTLSELLPEKLSNGHKLRNNADTRDMTVCKGGARNYSRGKLLCNCNFLRTLLLTFVEGLLPTDPLSYYRL